MTRLGWGILVCILLAAGLFASMLSFGPVRAPVARDVPAAEVADVAGELRVPVKGVARSAIADSWGDERGGGERAHQGTDIAAPAGTPVVAAAGGTVEKLFESAQGGTTAYVRSPDRRWTYYYAHLAGYAPGLAEGQPVRPGDPIGFVGDTGNAGAGNFHLHFGVSRMAPDDGWSGGEPVNPYPLLAGRRPRG